MFLDDLVHCTTVPKVVRLSSLTSRRLINKGFCLFLPLHRYSVSLRVLKNKKEERLLTIRSDVKIIDSLSLSVLRH